MCGICAQAKPISDFPCEDSAGRKKITCLKCASKRRKQHANRQARNLKQIADLKEQNNSMQACIPGQASEVQRLQQVLALLQAPEAINVEDQQLEQLFAQPPNSATISQLLGTPLLTEPLGTLPYPHGGTAGHPTTHHPATHCEDFTFKSGIEQGKDTMSKSEDLKQQQTCAADQVQSKRGSNSSDDNNTKRPKKCVPNPTLDQDNLVGAQQLLLLSRFREQGQSLDETRNLEHSAIDLDMFEVSFLETKNDSSAGTADSAIDLDHDTFAASFLETKNDSSAGTELVLELVNSPVRAV